MSPEGDEQEVAHPRTLYHTVRNNPPQEEDFLSNEHEGKVRPRQEGRVRYWQGFSAFDTLERARNKAISFPAQGHLVAEIAVAYIEGITYERSFSPGHYTVWAEPAVCVANVVAVYPVQDAVREERNEDSL